MPRLAMNKLQKGPRGSPVGQTIIGLLGLSQLGMAIWHAADPTKDVRAPTHRDECLDLPSTG